MKQRICATCNNTYGGEKRHNGKFCSMACYLTMRRLQHKSIKKTVKCNTCGKLFLLFPYQIKKKNFCSHQCTITRINKTCEVCGKGFIVQKRHAKQRFCSNACDGKFHSGVNSPRYVNGLGVLWIDKGKNWNTQRLKAIKRDSFTCQNCGTIPQRRKLLHVHHKIPYREFSNYEEANRLENLICLCASCHIKIENDYLTKVRSTV